MSSFPMLDQAFCIVAHCMFHSICNLPLHLKWYYESGNRLLCSPINSPALNSNKFYMYLMVPFNL